MEPFKQRNGFSFLGFEFYNFLLFLFFKSSSVLYLSPRFSYLNSGYLRLSFFEYTFLASSQPGHGLNPSSLLSSSEIFPCSSFKET